MCVMFFSCWLSPCYANLRALCTWDVQFVCSEQLYLQIISPQNFSAQPLNFCRLQSSCAKPSFGIFRCAKQNVQGTFFSGVVTVEVTLQMVHQLLGSIWQHPGFAFNNLSVVKICNCFGVGTYSVQHPVFYFLFLMNWNLLFLIMFALAEQRRPWTKAWCSVHPWTSPESFRVIRIISTWQ